MVKVDRVSSAARGIALFIGAFSLLNVAAVLRHGAFDGNAWWIDFRPLSPAIGRSAAALLGLALVAWALWPRMSRWRTALTVSLVLMGVAVALYNTVTFYRVRAAHVIATAIPIPFSILVVLVLAFILARAVRRGARLHVRSAILAFAACALGFPLAQIMAFGLTDYRRPADAILVFGAR